MSDESEVSWWAFPLLMVFAATVLFSILLIGNYPMYLSEVGNQQACEDAYGPSAVYVGDTGAGFANNKGALCQTDDGLKIVKRQSAPMNLKTFNAYLHAVAQGEV